MWEGALLHLITRTDRTAPDPHNTPTKGGRGGRRQEEGGRGRLPARPDWRTPATVRARGRGRGRPKQPKRTATTSNNSNSSSSVTPLHPCPPTRRRRRPTRRSSYATTPTAALSSPPSPEAPLAPPPTPPRAIYSNITNMVSCPITISLVWRKRRPPRTERLNGSIQDRLEAVKGGMVCPSNSVYACLWAPYGRRKIR